MDNLFTIGKLAREAGVNLQTVRYYERRKLLLPVGRKESGYRLYDEEALRRLKFIRHAKELGFTLKEVSELLDLRIDNISDCERAKSSAEIKLNDVEGKIESLEAVRRVLKGLIQACEKRKPTEKCPILKTIEKER
jgi:MerR family mercuric resistance operon transcriptional regulator/MerR family gold-responsive transcriptional activator of gol and ges genes